MMLAIIIAMACASDSPATFKPYETIISPCQQSERPATSIFRWHKLFRLKYGSHVGVTEIPPLPKAEKVLTGNDCKRGSTDKRCKNG